VCDLKDALQRGDALQLLDVRTPGEWDSGHIKGARHIPLPKLTGGLKRLPKDAPLAVICGSGYRSTIATSLLLARGFPRVQNVVGGMGAYQATNAPSGKPRIWCSARWFKDSFHLRHHRFTSLRLNTRRVCLRPSRTTSLNISQVFQTPMRKKRNKPRTDCILQFLFSEPDDLRNRLRQDKHRKT
jgi:rhodanese-related sulfurtransferase